MFNIQDTNEASVEAEKTERNQPTKGPSDLLVGVVGDNEPSLNIHTHEEYWLPKPVYFQMASVVRYLTIAFEKNVNEIYKFAVDDIVVEYKPDLMGINQSYTSKEQVYMYTYFEDHASVGIPTERYNWILAEAARATGLEISNNSLTQTTGYTWISTRMNKNAPVDCCIYLSEKENLVSIGILRDKVLALKSNLIGVGNFSRIAVMKTYDNKHVLAFWLQKFQLKDRTEKSSKIEVISQVEPSAGTMISLAISK